MRAVDAELSDGLARQRRSCCGDRGRKRPCSGGVDSQLAVIVRTPTRNVTIAGQCTAVVSTSDDRGDRLA